MPTRFIRFVAVMTTAAILNLSLVQAASAAMIGTGDAIRAADRAEVVSAAEAVLARAEVRAVLTAHGVTAEDALARVAALSEEELVALQQEFDQLPAGGIGLFEVLGVTFVVLLVLELTGTINIFSKF
jgi:hypothetical protein